MLYKLFVALSLLLTLLFSGCSNLFYREYLIISEHEDDYIELVPDSNIQEVRSYTGMKSAVENLVGNAMEYGVIHTVNYSGNTQDDISRACQEIVRESPKGVYAVEYMTHSIKPMLSYHEIEVFITYKRSAAEIYSIIEANTKRALFSQIDAVLDAFEPSLTLLLPSLAVSEKDITDYVESRYRSNPLLMPELPVLTISAYPSMESVQKIIRVEFDYSTDTATLAKRLTLLEAVSSALAPQLETENAALTALNICLKLTDIVKMREDGGVISRTAFGALGINIAGSEGCAMAFKLLCDKLGIECQVIEGRMNRERHFWNIIKVSDSYYHVDSFICGQNGMEVAFLKRDSDMLGSYWWDIEGKNICDGQLDYETLMSAAFFTETAETEEET